MASAEKSLKTSGMRPRGSANFASAAKKHTGTKAEGSMGGPGSGGHNRRSPEEHLLRGTFRADRHRVGGLRAAARPLYPDHVWHARAALADRLERTAILILTRKRTRTTLRPVYVAIRLLATADRLWRRLLASSPGPTP